MSARLGEGNANQSAASNAQSPHQQSSQRRPAWIALGILLATLTLLMLDTPLWARALAALLLAVGLPGLMTVVLAIGPAADGEGWLERALYAGGAGLTIAIVTLLALSMASGGITQAGLLITFGVIDLLLVGANFVFRQSPTPGAGATDRRMWLALVAVMVVGGILRFANIGYSEFQGDEARVMLRAGEVLAGYENALLVHQKGPAEILLSATFYGLDGWVTEAMARLPFTLASLWAIAAIFLLGWRLLGPAGGLVAGMVLALDGYVLAFGRIVQYQSVVILMALLTLLLLESTRRQPQRMTGRFLLAGLFVAGGLLAHYDILTVAIPALYLLWQIGRSPVGWRRLAFAMAPAALIAVGLALLFYIPYFRYPGFESTYRYVLNERLGTKWPYNNLLDVTQRTMLYSSSYYVIFLVATTLVAMAGHYRRQFGTSAGVAVLVVTAFLCASVYLGAQWAQVDGRDLAGLLLALPLVGVCLLPKVRAGERLAWLWFAPLFIGALFLIALPDTHVYIFFVPWALVVGAGLQRLWEWAGDTGRNTRPLVGAAGLILLIVFAIYPWLIFADAPSERLRTWQESRPRAYWYPWAMPPERGIFGFPLRNGWKVVGEGYASGALEGGFDFNARPEVANWYTRGGGVCPAEGRYYFLTDTVEPNDDERLAQVRAEVEQGHGLVTVADVNGSERLRIYDVLSPGGAGGAGGAGSGVAHWPLALAAPAFDRLTQTHIPGRRGHVLEARPQTALSARLGDGIRLQGFTLEKSEVAPGGQIPITLTWESIAPVYPSYTVFLHVVDPATNGKVGQRDALPVCGQNLTWQWNPGDIVEDPHLIDIAAEAEPGSYRLYAGLYDLQTGHRLPVIGSDGQPLGDFIDMAEITVR